MQMEAEGNLGVDAERIESFETLVMFAAWPIREALRATFVMFAAEAFFLKYGETWFATHPANNLFFAGLRALETQSLLDASEMLRDRQDLYWKPVIPRLSILLKHRDMAGHRGLVKWERNNRQEFFDAGHQHSPIRTGILWSIGKWLEAEVLRLGGECDPIDVPADPHMALMLHSILKLSMKEGLLVPPPELALAYLQQQKAGFVRELEKYPDGIVHEEQQ